ncbi:MAG: agmatine deiminase family protein [Bacteroidales bacterium]|nr:agmatine deiminase family protein [Bacteroidales bacterium]
MKKIVFSFLLMALGITLFAQKTPLPNNFSAEELLTLPKYHPPSTRSITTPPAFPVRTVAEWEEMGSVLVSFQYYDPFLTEIIRYAREETRVYVFCDDSNSVKNTLSSSGVDLSNISYFEHSMNSVWIRDYGANNIYKNDVEDLSLVDWVYNRNRPDDDTSPDYFAQQTGIPIYGTVSPPTDLVNTGGNFMSDGFGTAFASELVLDENDQITSFNQTVKTEADIDTIMKHFMGIDRYILMPTLPNDGIHHIDMHIKLLDEQTLLVGEYPTGVADGPQIEQNLQYVLDNYNSVFGKPYKVVRIPMPPDANGDYPGWSWGGGDYCTYTNSLILNKTVLVPIYNDEQYDTTALRIYRQAMPGYRIIGIDATDPISASGAIHCTTHEVGVQNPLLISHCPLPDTNDVVNDYQVDALIKHRDGIGSAYIYYRTDTTQPYQSLAMTLTNATNDTWTGYIPAQPSGTDVYYYIHAQATTGKQQNRPMPAPDGYWHFRVFNPVSVNLPDNDNTQITMQNPVTYQMLFSLNTDNDKTGAIVVYDMAGHEIYQFSDQNFTSGNRTYSYNVSRLNAGIYLVKFNLNGFVTEQKMVVVK